MLDASEFVLRDLLDRERITEEHLETARSHSQSGGVGVLEALLTLGVVDSRELAITRATVCESPYVDLEAYEIDLRNANLMPKAVAEKTGAFPLFQVDGTITVAMVDPLNLSGVDSVRQVLKSELFTVLCDEQSIRSLIARAYSMAPERSSTRHPSVSMDNLTTGQEPIVAAVQQILRRAIDEGASDVHINPDEHEMHLRYRIDGVLQTRQGPGLTAHAGVVQRLKVMAKLDLTQTRRPQDGKFRIDHPAGAIDVRMSTIPTVCGENVVLRLLRHGTSLKDFHELGVPEPIIEELSTILGHPYGMILVTGPTGSGKTTTLYTGLSKLNTPDRNLMTIEDPVEIRLPMVRQTQANPEVGLTFASALRSILRQDPDVILVGEIRDEETAQIAVQASLTGHLVLSTLHTNDAIGALARLRDFGLPPFAINSALLGVVAQRLIRRVCDACSGPDEPDEATLQTFHLTEEDAASLRKGRGCAKCMNTGYRGRIGVYELFRMSPALQSAIEQGASVRKVHEAARAEGMKMMLDDGLDKARLGLTTLDEMWKLSSGYSDQSAASPDPTARRISA